MAGGLLLLIGVAVLLTSVLALAIVGVMLLVNGRRARRDELDRLARELSELERARTPREP